MRKELKLEMSLSQILQVLSVNVFEPVPFVDLVAKTASQNETGHSHNKWVFNILQPDDGVENCKIFLF